MSQHRENRDQADHRVELTGGSTESTTYHKQEGRPASTPPLLKAAAANEPQASERAEIARRVAAFRERQLLLKRQREEYYDAVLAKTRAELRSGPRSTRR
ncbi:hypothetical protein BJ122_11573 [Rhodopseudomonas faecalis]|uniref:Uncharacterized protein n=2 Tax=Rhodopseudomonas faecalis TaxID=99655 RepID=A0A318TAA1_9BRAD|nr:hypothetical protein BJ122_11573 [Rhodopseudomonas faecalis]